MLKPFATYVFNLFFNLRVSSTHKAKIGWSSFHGGLRRERSALRSRRKPRKGCPTMRFALKVPTSDSRCILHHHAVSVYLRSCVRIPNTLKVTRAGTELLFGQHSLSHPVRSAVAAPGELTGSDWLSRASRESAHSTNSMMVLPADSGVTATPLGV